MGDEAKITYQPCTFAHGTETLKMPVGGSLREEVGFLPVHYGCSAFPQKLLIVNRGYFCDLDTHYLDTAECAVGHKASLVLTLQEAGGSTGSLTITNMVRGTANLSFRNPPYGKSLAYQSEGDATLSVSL